MKFEPLALAGACVVRLEPAADDRGFFARAWCRREFAERGLTGDFVQSSLSYNRRAGTLRGMHFQRPPHAEAKLVRCVAGSIFDVVIDLRAGSATYGRWAAVELSSANRAALYIPPGFAHGFQTLVDDTEVLYEISAYHQPDAAGGIRWDDPRFAIAWPPVEGSRVISARDAAYPDFAA